MTTKSVYQSVYRRIQYAGLQELFNECVLSVYELFFDKLLIYNYFYIMQLLPLDGGRRFTGNVIANPGDICNFIHYSI